MSQWEEIKKRWKKHDGLKAEIGRLLEELEWYRSLDLTRDEGVTSIGGNITRKLHALWTDAQRMKVAEAEVERMTVEHTEAAQEAANENRRLREAIGTVLECDNGLRIFAANKLRSALKEKK